MSEEWRPVPGYEGIYAVSNEARVRRLAGSFSALEDRLLTPTLGSNGYVSVALYRDGHVKGHLVHRLVLRAFHGEPPTGTEACHNDGDPTNNRLENLRWDSHQANCMDKALHGTDVTAAKTACRAGHEYTADNVFYAKADGRRRCRTCHNARGRRNYARAKEESER